MQITVNGRPRVVSDGLCIAELLRQLGLPEAQVAVEHNGVLVELNRLQHVTLEPDDRLELVRFVGGG